MSVKPTGDDRRQFGRRTTQLHGWICVAGRPRQACAVKNLTADDALLACDHLDSLPFAFDLHIEAIRFRARCEVRHMSMHGVGVAFLAREAMAPRVKMARPTVDEVAAWCGAPIERRCQS